MVEQRRLLWILRDSSGSNESECADVKLAVISELRRALVATIYWLAETVDEGLDRSVRLVPSHTSSAGPFGRTDMTGCVSNGLRTLPGSTIMRRVADGRLFVDLRSLRWTSALSAGSSMLAKAGKKSMADSLIFFRALSRSRSKGG